MSDSLTHRGAPGHVLRPDLRRRMAKAALKDVRKADLAIWRSSIGRAIERIRMLCGLSLKEFADAIDRDERQVARWISGSDRPQLDAIFAVESLRQPMVVAFAELAGEGVEVVTEIRVRRRA